MSALRRVTLSILLMVLAATLGPVAWADLPDSGYAVATPTNPGSALTDFTLVVNLATQMPASWWSAVDTSDGTKGRAAIDSGPTEVATDWIDFDDTAETGWVLAKWSGTLSSVSTQKLRIYPPKAANSSYAASSTYGSDNAYTSSRELDWPLFSDFNDRTSAGLDGTGRDGVTAGGGNTGPSGQPSTSFDGTDQRVDIASSVVSEYPASAECWVRLTDTTDERIMQIADSAASDKYILFDAVSERGWEIQVRTGGGFDTNNFSVANGGTLDTTAFHHMVWVSSGSASHKLYVDGVFVEEDTHITSFPTADKFGVGGEVDSAAGYSDLDVFGVAIYSQELESDWIAEEYAQSNDQATFWGTWSWVAPSGGNIIPLIQHYNRMRRADRDHETKEAA